MKVVGLQALLVPERREVMFPERRGEAPIIGEERGTYCSRADDEHDSNSLPHLLDLLKDDSPTRHAGLSCPPKKADFSPPAFTLHPVWTHLSGEMRVVVS